MTVSANGIWIGIDPGKNGGICMITRLSEQGKNLVDVTSVPATEADVVKWIKDRLSVHTVKGVTVLPVFAMIEQQTPRPTHWVAKGPGREAKSSILKSTVLLYGNYMLQRGILMALAPEYGIRVQEVSPRGWQSAFKLKRKKTDTNTQWKNTLKARAQELFPDVRVTLAISDALLITEYCRRENS